MARKSVTKAKSLKRLRARCRKLWTELVKKKYGNKCAICGSNKYVNAHHIESFELNKRLRFEVRNGVPLCVKHHKFGKFAFHKSFITAWLYLVNHRKDDLEFLTKIYKDDIKETVEYLENTIKKLSNELKEK